MPTQTNTRFMKFSAIFTATVLLAASKAPGQQSMFTNAVNQAVPDGNPTGLTSTINVSGVSGIVGSLNVYLDIVGGYNGDLYATLSGPTGTYSVLLNRVGVNSSNPFGYSDAGLSITLSDTGSANVHWYQSGSYNVNSQGQVTGTWLADGLTVDLQSSPSAADSTTPTAGLQLFDGTNPNGNWTLFIADLVGDGGQQSTLEGWSMDISTLDVPEPGSASLALLGAVVMVVFYRRQNGRKFLCRQLKP